MTKVSVIVPVYNVETYLDEAVRSVLQQTISDWEMIMVDDGSTDNSGPLCDSYAAVDPRIKVIHQENRGLSGARNTGMKYAQGEFLQFLDADDRLYPDALEKAYTAAVDNNVGIVIFDAYIEGNGWSYHEGSPLSEGVYSREEILKALIKPIIPPYAWNKFCRRKLYDGIQFPEGEKWEDVSTTFQPVMRTERIMVLNKPLYCYRQREDAISKTAAADNSIWYWRYHSYLRRYRMLKEYDPNIAEEALDSVFRNGIYCFALYLTGEEYQKERTILHKQLSSAEFRNLSKRKLRILRRAFLILPELTAAAIRKRVKYKNGSFQ